MSAACQNIYGALPATTRGKPLHLGPDPKGNNFVYTCGSGVFIRNLRNPIQTEMYTEHSFPTTVGRYAPSGFYIASGDVSGTLRIWDTTQKEHILKIEFKVLAGPILDIQWSDDSKRIAVVGEGKEKFGAVILWDTGSSVGEITGHTKAITSVDFKQTRPYRVATGSEDFQVNWFEGPPFKFHHAMKEHTRFVNCVRFSPDGNKLLTVSSDKTGFFYDGKTGELVGKLNPNHAHQAGIYSCSWSADSRRVLTASADKTCKVWDSNNGDCLVTFNFFANPQVEDQFLGCLWQGEEMIAVTLAGDIYYLDINSPDRPRRVQRGHQKAITALAHDPHSNSIYTGSYDSLIVNWDIDTGATAPMVGKGHTNQINKMYIQGDNLVTCAMDDSVRFTPLHSKQYSNDAVSLDSTPADIAVGRPNSRLVIAVVTDNVIVIRDGRVAYKHPVRFQPTSVGLSVDDTHVAVGGKDNKIHLYNISGDRLSDGPVLEGHRGPLSAVTFSPDGKYLGSADQNRDIFIWDLASKQIKIQGWVYHTARVSTLSWSPDSLHLVSGSLDSNLFIWNIEQTNKRIQIKEAHQGGVNNAIWLNNNTVASVGQDCTLKTWRITF